MVTDYADDIVLLANIPTQAEFLLHSLDQAARDIGLHRNTDKMEYKKETSPLKMMVLWN